MSSRKVNKKLSAINSLIQKMEKEAATTITKKKTEDDTHFHELLFLSIIIAAIGI